jgi:Phytanoyl-CoA dioxygenase (PhyH)
MTQAGAIELPRMQELVCSNAYLGDPQAMARILDEQGYLFFQEVMPKRPVAELKRAFIDLLIDWGYVDKGAEEPVWNGRDLSGFPAKLEPLHEARAWEPFIAAPQVNALFEGILGEKPFWVPVVEYRATPPSKTQAADPFKGRHQDGFYNEGMVFRTCWIPLMEIDEWRGGLALAPGAANGRYLHDKSKPPQFEIPADAIPAEGWWRAHYRPGDLVMFNTMIPHSGLPNYTDQFRLSMDIRVMPESGAIPLVGELAGMTPTTLTIRDQSGQCATVIVDEETYIRGNTGKRIPNSEMLERLSIGQRIMATVQNNKAILVRPPR